LDIIQKDNLADIPSGFFIFYGFSFANGNHFYSKQFFTFFNKNLHFNPSNKVLKK